MEHELRCGNLQATVSEKGGTATSLTYDEVPILYSEKLIKGKLRGGCPICFPFFGEPKEEFAEIERHGWLRHQELETINLSDKEVEFLGRNEPIEQYPWKLEYKITVSISDSPTRL